MTGVNEMNAVIRERSRVVTEIQLIKTQIINSPAYNEALAMPTLNILDHIIENVINQKNDSIQF